MKPLALLLFTAITTTCVAQDVILSQPYANQLYLNPAFTGSSDAHRLTTNYRNQWGGGYVTGMASYDQNIIDSANGIGLLAELDDEGLGLTTTTSVMALYAHNFHFGKSFWLSAGIEAGIISTKFNKPLIPSDPGIPELITQPSTVGDFSAGILGYGKCYYFSLAVNHIAEPQQNFGTGLVSEIERRYTLAAGGMINIAWVTLSPNIYFQTDGGGSMYIYPGLDMIIKNIVQIGAWCKTDAISPLILMVGLQLKYIHVSYSIDIPNPYNVPDGFGNAFTHEFSLALLLPNKAAHSNKINCPNF